MGAVFQRFIGHDRFGNGHQFFFVIDPSGLDGGLAGHGMEHFVPHGVRLRDPAPEQILRQSLHGPGGVIRA